MILWLIDPLTKLKLEKDSSFFLAYLSAQIGKKNLFTHEIYLENSELKCLAYELDISVDVNKFPGNTVKVKTKPSVVALKDIETVMNRLEPPLDERYLLQSKLLMLHPRVLNSPVALQAYSEKLLPLQFEKGIPSSVGLDRAPDDGVIKPMNIFGGTGVAKVSKGDVISKEHMYQPFREVIAKGEQRYFILGNKVFGEVLKTPSEKDFRSNSVHGSTMSFQAPNAGLTERTQALVPKLNGLGIYMAAVDFVGDEVIEINFTCPGLWNLLYVSLDEGKRKELIIALGSF